MFTHKPVPSLPVPPAHGGEIADETLELLIGISAKIARNAIDELTEAEGQLFTLAVGPLLDELLQHRRRMAVIADLASPNVVFLAPGARG